LKGDGDEYSFTVLNTGNPNEGKINYIEKLNLSRGFITSTCKAQGNWN